MFEKEVKKIPSREQTYPTKREKENHRLKSAKRWGIHWICRRVYLWELKVSLFTNQSFGKRKQAKLFLQKNSSSSTAPCPLFGILKFICLEIGNFCSAWPGFPPTNTPLLPGICLGSWLPMLGKCARSPNLVEASWYVINKNAMIHRVNNCYAFYDTTTLKIWVEPTNWWIDEVPFPVTFWWFQFLSLLLYTFFSKGWCTGVLGMDLKGS